MLPVYLEYIVRKGFPQYAEQRVAIGLSRESVLRPWTWTNGKPLGYTSGYLTWNSRKRSMDCAYVYLTGGVPFGWRNDDCDQASAISAEALCEREA